MMDTKGLLLLLFAKKFYKKSPCSGVNMYANNEYPLDLAEELHKPVIRKFKKRTVYSGFKDNIWDADLADTQLITKFNKELRFLLCVIDIFSKYAWVVPLKDKKGITITNTFQKVLEESNSSKVKSKDTNQAIFELLKEVNFTIALLKNC